MKKQLNESQSCSYFRLVLKLFFEKAGWGAQSKIAAMTNVPRSIISDYLAGNKPMSEKHRETLSEYHGYIYEDLLAIGRELDRINSKQNKDIFVSFNIQILEKIRKEYNFPLSAFAYWINVKKIIYEFKEKGFLPITFLEASTILNEIKKTHPNFVNPLQDILKK